MMSACRPEFKHVINNNDLGELLIGELVFIVTVIREAHEAQTQTKRHFANTGMTYLKGWVIRIVPLPLGKVQLARAFGFMRHLVGEIGSAIGGSPFVFMA
ncbi:hypothetical protein CC2G_003389 [Coprinopsis cinerea AmutBmut pab1-1]|nr:hypothetical protein CC2G_003389 [Coprinopsis cinerea AmutBmut pab1-1]